MIISKTLMVRWNGFTRKWYEDKGYKWTKLNEYFECKIEDVQLNSTVKVEAKCDYCGEIFYPEYRQLLSARGIINKDCCSNRKCMGLKSKESNMKIYGVENHTQLESSREKSSKRQQPPFKEVLKDFEEKNLELLSKESDYHNDRSRLLFICKIHKEVGIQETNYANIKKNKGCCNYGKGELCAESSRLDGSIVYQAFIDKGMIPKFISSEYNKYNQMLPFICPDHINEGVQYKNYATLLASPYKCNYCAWEVRNELLRTDRNEILEYYESRGLVVEDINEYENKEKPIKFRCLKHLEHVQHSSYSNLKNTQVPCEHCRVENSLSTLNRNLRSSLGKWRKESIKLCDNKCVFTNNKIFDVHHLQPFNEIIKEAVNILNIKIKDKYTTEEYINIKRLVVELHNKYPLGVCISNKIHNLFHSLYSKESSIEDFYEFKRRYELGEFKEILKDIS